MIGEAEVNDDLRQRQGARALSELRARVRHYAMAANISSLDLSMFARWPRLGEAAPQIRLNRAFAWCTHLGGEAEGAIWPHCFPSPGATTLIE